MAQFLECGTPINLSASGVVSKTGGTLLGFYCNSTSGGTVVIGDATVTGSGAISGTITPAIGWNPFPAVCVNGCYVTIAAAAANITAFFAAG